MVNELLEKVGGKVTQNKLNEGSLVSFSLLFTRNIAKVGLMAIHIQPGFSVTNASFAGESFILRHFPTFMHNLL